MAFAYFDELGTLEGQRAFIETIARLVRAGRLADAEAHLSRHIAALAPLLVDVLAEVEAGEPHLAGWTRINTSLLAGEWPAATAISIDLSDRTNDDGEPQIQLSIYSDPGCPLVATPAEALAAFAEPAGWHAAPDETSLGALMLAGMADLFGMIAAEKAQPEPAELGSDAAIGLFLAEWWQTLRFHRLIHDAHRDEALVRPITLVVGANGHGPRLVSLLQPPALAEDVAAEHDEAEVDAANDDTAEQDAAALATVHDDALGESDDDDMPRTPVLAPIAANAGFSVTALRRKLAAETEPEAPPRRAGLFGRLLRRK